MAGPDAHPRGLTRLPAAQAEEVLDGVGASIDALGGAFTMPYTTVVVTAARIGQVLGITRQSAWERFSGEE